MEFYKTDHEHAYKLCEISLFFLQIINMASVRYV